MSIFHKTRKMSQSPQKTSTEKSKLIVPENYPSKLAPKKTSSSQLKSNEIYGLDRWWNFEGHPRSETPVFEGIDSDLVTKDITEQLAKGIFPLIEIPQNILRTLQLLDDPDFGYADVAALIERSPGMTGEFLKIINSSLVSHGVVIHDLKAALPRLGKVKVKSLLYMYSAKMNFFGNPLFMDLAVDIVEHSYAVGLITSYLGHRYYPDPDTAFVAGLLHDIGKLAILKAIVNKYDLPKESEFPITEKVFENIFPGLHEKAGKFIADHWQLDEGVKAAIIHHHDLMIDGSNYEYPDLAERLTMLVNISDTMARILGKGSPIEKVNVFTEPSVCNMEWEHCWSTVEYLDAIPEIISFKLDRK